MNKDEYKQVLNGPSDHAQLLSSIQTLLLSVSKDIPKPESEDKKIPERYHLILSS